MSKTAPPRLGGVTAMGSKWLVLQGLGKFASAVTEGRGGAVFDIPSLCYDDLAGNSVRFPDLLSEGLHVETRDAPAAISFLSAGNMVVRAGRAGICADSRKPYSDSLPQRRWHLLRLDRLCL